MKTLQESPPGTSRVHIDKDLLLRQAHGLAEVRRKRRTWNEYGVKLVREHLGEWLRTPDRMEMEVAEWRLAKELVHEVIVNRDPQYEPVRRRLGNPGEPSTRVLMSTLSLWLAGVLRMSTSVTIPMVAAMLYGVAEAGGDWEVLAEK